MNPPKKSGALPGVLSAGALGRPGFPNKPRPKPVRPAQPLQHARGSRLHIGCGKKRLHGWINADAVPGVGEVVLDLHAGQLGAETYREIYACHVLEHCWPQDTPAILRRLREALLPGGTLRISVPDLRLVVKNCVDSTVYGGERSALTVLFGGDFSKDTAAPDLHRQAFWKERLERMLVEAGFTNVREWGFGQYPQIDALRDYATWPQVDGKSTISLNLEADRPGTTSIRGTPLHASGATTGAVAFSSETSAAVDVSVLLGTVNRPDMLKDCVEAVRKSFDPLLVPKLNFEIVVAYGDANDESLPWMRLQRDIVPVHGGRNGAIEAFNIAYAKSRGRFICWINDDVIVDGDSISRAALYLYNTQAAAGVVFKFDRGDGDGYRHEKVAGTLHPNQIVVRREACEAVIEHIGGLWGDAAHRTDRTYGGDTAFGVLCSYLGLRLDSVAGVSCRDLLAKDKLREENAAAVAINHGTRWRSMFLPYLPPATAKIQMDEWPYVYNPRPGMAPRNSPVEAGRPLKLLHLSVQSKLEPQTDMRRAFAKIGPTVSLPWLDRHREVIASAESLKPDVVFAQIQSAAWSPEMISALRRVVGPDCALVHWTGDVRTSGTQRVERWMVEYGHQFDLMLSDNTTYATKLAIEEKVPAACGFLSCGAEAHLNYLPEGWDKEEDAHGAVFIGNNYPGLPYDRSVVFEEIERALPGLLSIYGSGWRHDTHVALKGPLHPGDAAGVMHAAAVTVSTSLFHDLGRYTSDRLKRALCAGAVVAVRAFEDMAGHGLVHGDNCLVWHNTQELTAILRDWTRPGRAADRKKM